MTPEELRAAMQTLGLSAGGLARLVLVEGSRTVRRWLAGERDVPGPVVAHLRLLIACPEARAIVGLCVVGS